MELNDDILVISSVIYSDFWGNEIDKRFVKRKTYSVLLGDKQAQSFRKIGSTPPYIYSHEPKFLGDNVALDVIDGKNSYGEGGIRGSNRYIYLIDPRTGRKIKEIKLPDFKDNAHFRFTIDSDGKNLIVSPLGRIPQTIDSDDKNSAMSSLRRGGLQLEPPVLITEDGNLRKIEFPIQYLDSIFNIENAPLVYPNVIYAVAITNQLLAITVTIEPSEYRIKPIITFWQRYPELKLIDAFDWEKIRIIDSKENNILISYSSYQPSSKASSNYRLLTFSLDNKTFTQSDIQWSCVPKNNQLSPGLIDRDNLILRGSRKVATIPIKNLHSSQAMFDPKCESN